MEERHGPRPRGRKVLACPESRRKCAVAGTLTVGEEAARQQGSLVGSGLGCRAEVFGCGPMGN